MAVLLISCGEDSFLKQTAELNVFNFPFGSSTLSLYWRYEPFPELTIDTILAPRLPGMRKYFSIPDSTAEYANSPVYQLGRLPNKDPNLVPILHMYQNSSTQGFSVMRPEPQVDLVVHSNTGAIIDRLSLHSFDCGDGFLSTSFEIDSAQTIRISRLESRWNETFTVNTQRLTIKEYKIDSTGKFVQSKKEISINLDDQNKRYKFEEFKIYESVWLNQSLPESAIKSGTVKGTGDTANMYYHTWTAPVATIPVGTSVMFVEMPAIYGPFYLAQRPGADERLFWIRKDLISIEYSSDIEDALSRFPHGLPSVIDIGSGEPIPLSDSAIARISVLPDSNGQMIVEYPDRGKQNDRGGVTNRIEIKHEYSVDGEVRELVQSDMGKFALFYTTRELDEISEEQREIKPFHDVIHILDSIRFIE